MGEGRESLEEAGYVLVEREWIVEYHHLCLAYWHNAAALKKKVIVFELIDEFSGLTPYLCIWAIIQLGEHDFEGLFYFITAHSAVKRCTL
jgi:hypothetical protein